MAFADESFREDPTEGVYVLAAAVLEVRAQQPAGELMRRLLGSWRTTKLHWHEMDRLQQKDAAHRFRVDHIPGSAEPLLWVADVVADVVRASRQGSPVQLELLGERVHMLEVPTGC